MLVTIPAAKQERLAPGIGAINSQFVREIKVLWVICSIITYKAKGNERGKNLFA